MGNRLNQMAAAVEITSYTAAAGELLCSPAVEVDDGETVETSAYDATGLRRQKTADGSTTHFVWDRVNLLAELDGSLARVAQYSDFPGRWGGLSSQRRSSTSSYFGFDLSANTRALFNGGGITDRYLYEAFGVEQIVTGSTVNPLRFGGQVGYFREGAERLYVRARYYSLPVGRWYSRDPADYSGLVDQYSYAINRPTTLVDPSGEFADLAIVAIIAALVAAGMLLCAAINCLYQALGPSRDAAYKAQHWAEAEHPGYGNPIPRPGGKPDIGHNDAYDAMRHCVWMCELRKAAGSPCARFIGWMKELSSANQQEKDMDLHNNEVGRRLAGQHGSCRDNCWSAFESGELVVIAGPGIPPFRPTPVQPDPLWRPAGPGGLPPGAV